jgi:hypothetical protein
MEQNMFFSMIPPTSAMSGAILLFVSFFVAFCFLNMCFNLKTEHVYGFLFSVLILYGSINFHSWSLKKDQEQIKRNENYVFEYHQRELLKVRHDKNGGFVESKKVGIGDHVETSDGKKITVVNTFSRSFLCDDGNFYDIRTGERLGVNIYFGFHPSVRYRPNGDFFYEN